MKKFLIAVLVLIADESLTKNAYTYNIGRQYTGVSFFRNSLDCERCILVCEQSQNRVIIVEIPSGVIIWEWRASDSNVAPEHIKWFNFPDEAKPVYNNKYILSTASGGGVALIRIADKKTVFYAYAGGNPHSAEILPDGNIVSSSSTGNFLTLFKVDTVSFPDNILFKTYPITDGHNVVWDKTRKVLWAGSGKQLYAYDYNSKCNDPSLKLSDSLSLPDNLHDLFPVYNEDALWLTADSNVFKLKFATKKFEQVSLRASDHIKSISSGPANFPAIIIHPKEKWWTDEILTTDGNSLFMEKGLKIYKARWLLDNTFSYPRDQKIKICR